jgi:exodeoxyribonuclease VII small subunit
VSSNSENREPDRSADEPTPTFEEALQQLETIVHALEEGRLGLGESLAHYENGVKLLKRCHGLLERAERRIELLSGVDAEGRGMTETLDDRSLSLDEKAQSRGRRRSKTSRPTPPAADGGGLESGGAAGAMDDPGSLF